MFYSLLLIGVIAGLVFTLNRWKTLPEAERASFVKKAVLYGAAIAILLLVLAGRAPWLMGILAALLALLARLTQFVPYIAIFKKLFGQSASAAQSAVSTKEMSRQEAADILGVTIDANAEEVRLAHKKLMQKIHPDRGGSDALAKQINQAKSILLDEK